MNTLQPSPRIYKRWILLSSLATFAVAWIVLPYWFNGGTVPSHLTNLSGFVFENGLLQYLAGLKFPEDLPKDLASLLKPFWVEDDFHAPSSPGMILKNKGAKAHFPVVLVPGIISTGLELWEGKECARYLFRQRLWGTLTMLRAILADRNCWLEHMKLNPVTGLDPDDIKLRPAQGLEAADFLLPGFWVWARIIENLAELGYDHNNLQMAAYDWRLDVTSLEIRDQYFTRLKAQIETLVKTNNRKVVVLTHSLGATIFHYFMKWVEADIASGPVKGGKGGPQWVSQHMHSVVHIGGTLLGAPKSLSILLSGEMKDTVQMGRLEAYILEMFLSKSERLKLFRTWYGGFGILPKGGDQIWGTKPRMLQRELRF